MGAPNKGKQIDTINTASQCLQIKLRVWHTALSLFFPQ